MLDVESARAAMEQAARALDIAARPHFACGRYGAWAAMERGDKLPAQVSNAIDAHHSAAMQWARARGLA